MSMHPSLERVGMRVASEQDRMLAGAALPDADLLLAGVAARRALAGRRANVRRGVIAAATSAMLVVLVVFLGLRARSTHVTVAATTTPALHARQQPDLGVRRAESGNLPLAFVDGTNVVVKRGSVAELREVGIHRGVIALTSGTVDVHVVHTETSRWDVLAGPFESVYSFVSLTEHSEYTSSEADERARLEASGEPVLALAGRGNLSDNSLRIDLLQRHLLHPGWRGLEAFDHFGGRVLHAAEDVGWRIGQASGDFGRRGDGGEFFG